MSRSTPVEMVRAPALLDSPPTPPHLPPYLPRLTGHKQVGRKRRLPQAKSQRPCCPRPDRSVLFFKGVHSESDPPFFWRAPFHEGFSCLISASPSSNSGAGRKARKKEVSWKRF